MSLGRGRGLSFQTMEYAHATTMTRPGASVRHRGDTACPASPSRQRVLDAVIVGGGPAGLSAALVLGRARKRVLVLDTGRPANAASAAAIGGLLSHDGITPRELRRNGRDQLTEFPTVEVRDGEVVDADPLATGVAVRIGDGHDVRARALVLAHGLRYDPPPLPGVRPLWGRSVFHCPFCDGWEVRDRPLAVHGNGPAAARSALVLSGWSNDVLLCTDGPADLNGMDSALRSAGVQIRQDPIRELVGHDGRLDRIEFLNGPAEGCEALFVRTDREQPNGLAEALGCDLGDGGTIETDVDGRTAIPGIYAAGDAATDHARSVANAVGSGSRAAYAVALDLVTAA
jgi:thioredoxin reductase